MDWFAGSQWALPSIVGRNNLISLISKLPRQAASLGSPRSDGLAIREQITTAQHSQQRIAPQLLIGYAV
ncbi:hypothetical protein PGTUg99_009281 [Puccinia graminis f. sp. tritici]|uniref:Uncharacterized protein n=1 Tax=Puccinia graminis f. sp. tritici TaxID=56615 RepID=A0A5B0NVI2_PUCGR|nr:hypothetical protein PGTUg99_009281 [Puccinia graminis f. sp. tritici]